MSTCRDVSEKNCEILLKLHGAASLLVEVGCVLNRGDVIPSSCRLEGAITKSRLQVVGCPRVQVPSSSERPKTMLIVINVGGWWVVCVQR